MIKCFLCGCILEESEEDEPIGLPICGFCDYESIDFDEEETES